MSNLKFIGYHGTNEQAYIEISRDSRFKESVNKGEIDYTSDQISYHWLGRGVYFWSNDIGMARFWATRNEMTGKVIEVELQCRPEECFDLNIYSNWKKIDGFVTYLMEYYNIRPLTDLEDRQNRLYPLMGKAIDYLFSKELGDKYKLVYYNFRVTSSEQTVLDKITPQICVKNQEVINFEKLKCHEVNRKSKKKTVKSMKSAHNKKAKLINLEEMKIGK